MKRISENKIEDADDDFLLENKCHKEGSSQSINPFAPKAKILVYNDGLRSESPVSIKPKNI